MKEVPITVMGKKAMVREDWAPMFLLKHALVEEAMTLPSSTIMGKIIKINRRIASKGAFVKFV